MIVVLSPVTVILILPVVVPERIKTFCIEFFLTKIFVSFVKLLDIILDEYGLFLSHVKSGFLMMIVSEHKKVY